MLAAYYQAPFDVATLGLGTLTLATAGKSNVVINLAALTASNDDASSTSSIFWHYIGSGSGATSWCTSLDGANAARLTHHARVPLHVDLEAAIQAEATTQTWTNPAGLTVAFRRQDNPITYRFAYTEANVSLTWSTAAGRALLGFAANQSGAQTYDGTLVPTYVVTPTLEFTSMDSPDYEDEETGNHMTPDDNSAGFGVSRYVARVRRDWVQQFETKELSFRDFAATAAPWTFQHLYQYCRGERPFAIATVTRGSTDDDVAFFSLNRVAWKPTRDSAGNDAQFHIPFECVVIGVAP